MPTEVRTYDPGDVLLIAGAFPILEWDEIILRIGPSRVLERGTGDEVAKCTYRNSREAQLDIVVPYSSPYNVFLSGLNFTDLPFAVGLIDLGGASKVNEALKLGFTGGLLTMQAFLWPTTIEHAPDLTFRKSSSSGVWRLKGLMIPKPSGVIL